jgi:hypothetical protein
MGLILSAAVVAAGVILITAVEGSLGGVAANTIGAVLVLFGLLSALIILVVGAMMRESTAIPPARDEDEANVFPRR